MDTILMAKMSSGYKFDDSSFSGLVQAHRGKRTAVEVYYSCVTPKTIDRDHPVRRIPKQVYDHIQQKRAELRQMMVELQNLERDTFANAESLSWDELQKLAEEGEDK